MGKKLSITQRSYDKTGWHKSSQFSSSDIKDIKVFKAKNDKSLNAIPSPFARIHLFEAAFDLLDKDELNQTDYSGDVFKKLVSDCFDVFEILYNWNNHIRDGKKLQIVKWNRQAEIEKLKLNKAKHKLLGETFEIFFNEESFENYEEILIIKINNRPIAGSSPFTGFFTSPGNIQDVALYNPLNRGNYFSKIIPFKNRKPEIQKYIQDFFDNPTLRHANSTKAIRTYLTRHTDANEIPQLPLENISLGENQTVDLFGQPLLSSSKKTEVDYFEKYLVRINYKINDEFFHTPLQHSKSEKSYDYILPITPLLFEEIGTTDVSKIVSISEKDKDTVEISLQLSGSKISKRYHTNNIFGGHEGQLIDLVDSHSIKLNVGIFPFLKMIPLTPDINYNDFYKVAFILQDDSNMRTNKDFHLKFGKNGRLIENGNVYNVTREERTLESDQTGVGSTYYSLNTVFDFIQIQFDNLTAHPVRGIIVPRWRECTLGSNRIDYSIDFGTTTTFIAYNDDHTLQKEPRPFEIDETESQVVMLNKPLKRREEFTAEDCFEKSIRDFEESVAVQKQEFLPSILTKAKYKFPIRTVLFQKKSVPDINRKLFSNANIAFTYQREPNLVTHLNQEYISDLKWNIKTNDSYKTSTKIYLEELFYLLRTKTLLHNGDPRKSKITWFSPLSLTPSAKKDYAEIWEELFMKIFKSNNKSQINNLTESEAPYYFLYKQASINNLSSVLTLDIGGGSTDIMLFQENTPRIGTSVHFGANVLWGNGFNDFKTDRSNGIFNSIKQKITANLSTSIALADYNENVMANYGSDEIINFWLINKDVSGVVDELKTEAFKLSYLIHLSSLVFHAVSMLKVNGYQAPSCIIFSGNGSKYVDLIQSGAYIEKICGYFTRAIFKNSALADPQVILPEENRKEATCYGGLYRPTDAKQYKAINYLGFEDNLAEFSKYIDIDTKRDFVMSNVNSSFTNFLELFFKMNDEEDLSFRIHFGIERKLQAIKDFLNAKSLENLNMGYDKRRNTVDGQDVISDSLFFYPLVGLIFKLNNVSTVEMDKYSPKMVFYGLSPDGINMFLIERLSAVKKADSIFSITVHDDNPNVGVLDIIESSSVHRKALSIANSYLEPVCDWDTIPRQGDQVIKVLSSGAVEKEGDLWRVKKRLKIEFL